MCDQRWMFEVFRPIKRGTWPEKGIGTENALLFVCGIGDIPIRTKVDGQWNNGIIQKVIFVPGLGTNLFSVSCATKQGAALSLS